MSVTAGESGIREIEKTAEKVFTRAVYLLETTGKSRVDLNLTDLGEDFQQNMLFKLTSKTAFTKI
jgi:hypothetical protein